MATITKLPSGKFRAQVRRKGIYKAQTFLRKLDAQAWAVEHERAIEGGSSAGVIQPPAAMTLNDVIDAYVRQVPLSKAGDHSMQQIGRTIGKTPLRSFNAVRVQDWIAERQASGLVASSIVRHLGRLSQMLHWARDVRNIDINPELVLEARRKFLRHTPANTRLRDRIPTPEELERLRQYFREEFRGAAPMDQIMDFALVTAMRVGEICRISFEDVNREQKTVLIRDRKDPKQKIGNNQIVPLLPAAMRIVEARWEVLGGKGRIFPYRAPYVSETWYHSTRKLQIDDLTFHDLRHAAITELFRKGLGIPEVALVSGHRSWRELKRYTQLTANDVLTKFHALEGLGG